MRVHRCSYIRLIVLVVFLFSLAGCDAMPFLNNDGETSPDSVNGEESQGNDQSEESGLAVQVLEATMGSTLNPAELTIDNPTTAFSKEDEIHILFLTNIEGNQDVYYRVEWYDPRGMNVQTEENIIHSGQSKWYVSARPGPGGWSAGTHTVRLYFNGALNSTLNFTVSEP